MSNHDIIMQLTELTVKSWAANSENGKTIEQCQEKIAATYQFFKEKVTGGMV